IHESYSVLSDVDLRAQYERDHPEIASAPAPAAPLPKDEARAAERRARLARHPYVAKLTRVQELLDSGRKSLASGDFSTAFTDLHLASRLDPKNQDVHELLNQVRHRHEQQRAAEELKRGEAAEREKDLVGAARCYLNAANLDPKSSLAASKAAKLLLQPGQD